MINLFVAPLTADPGTTTGSSWITFLPLVALVVAFYFFVIRPQQKQEKKKRSMLGALKTGDLINTVGGIYGRIVEMADDVVTIEVGSEKTRLVVARWAVANVDNGEKSDKDSK